MTQEHRGTGLTNHTQKHAHLSEGDLLTIGSMDTILVHAREVFRAAIIAAASAIILMHNHPSGDAGPSEADIKVTRDLIRAGQLLKLEVLDHIIVGHGTWVSLRQSGYFYEG